MSKFLSNLLLILLTLCGMYCGVYNGFYLQQSLPLDFQFIYVLAIAALFVACCYAVIKLTQSFRGAAWWKIPLAILFIAVNCGALYKISSMNRENEIQAWFQRNESNLIKMVSSYDSHESDAAINQLRADAHIKRFYYRKGIYRFKLYNFLGYGYKLAYTKDQALLSPENCFEASPLVKYFKIKDHWSYYSYSD